MFPEPALPKRVFSIPMARNVSVRFYDSGRETAFNELPAGWKIRVTFRQGHDDVKVVWQHDHGVDFERVLAARYRHRHTQIGNVIGQDA
jgi:hypothetical protein